MKDLLRKMFQGWILHEESYDSGKEEYTRTPEECMTEVCDGDELEGNLLVLFGHWSNDIQSLAAYYGLSLAREQTDGSMLHDDGTVDTLLKGGKLTIVEIPAAPSPEHYWHRGAWQEPQRDDPREAAVAS